MVIAADVPDVDCAHSHALKSSLRGLRAVYRDPAPMTRRRGAKGWHFVRCTRTREARAAARRKLLRWREWRMENPWLLAWERLAAWERGWANSTAWCETGGTMSPTIHNPSGIYHGMMQFDLRTWAEAGGTGDPHTHTANEQKVRAVWLMRRVGDERWPVCGD